MKNELSLFHDDFGLFPRGFFSNFMNDSFWDSFNFGGFKVDVKEKKDTYIIEAEMPGIQKDQVNIEVDDHILTVSADINESSDQKDEDGRYLRRERRTGSFRRSFSLENIKRDEIRADMSNGVLTIYCPKLTETTPKIRKIDIQ